MQITVKLFATLRKDKQEIQQINAPENSLVRDILHMLEIDLSEVSIIMINGRISKLDHMLKSEDVVAFFPLVGGG